MSVKRSIAWAAAGQLVIFSVQFFAQIFITRLLSPSEIGISVVGFSTMAALNMVQMAGLRNYVIREVDFNEHTINATFSVNAVIAAGLALILCSIGLGNFLYGIKSLGIVFIILVLVPLIGIFELVPSALLQRNMKFRELSVANAGRGVISAGVTVVAALEGMSAASVAVGAVAGALFAALSVGIAMKGERKATLTMTEWRPIFVFGLQMLTTSGLSSVASRLADLIVGWTLGLSALGLFSRASALNGIVWDNVHSVLMRVILSDFAKRVRQDSDIAENYASVLEIITVVFWPIFIGVAILAKPFIFHLYGPRWLPAAPVLSLISLSGVFTTCVTMAWELFILRHKTSQQTRLEGIRAIASMVLMAIGSTIGLVGAGLAKALDGILCIILYRSPIEQMTGVSRSVTTRIYLRNAGIVIPAVTPPFAMMAFYNWNAQVPLVFLACSVFLSICIWILMLFKTAHPLAREIRSIKRTGLKRKNLL